MKKQISLALTVLFVFLSFSVCGCKGEKGKEGIKISAESGSGEVLDLSASYTVVRAYGDDETSKLGAKIFKAFKENGIKVVNGSDFDAPTGGEILIGNTNRPESAAALEMLKERGGCHVTDYIICVIGKNVVINAMSKDALSVAADAFITEYCKTGNISDGTVITGINNNFKNITLNGTSVTEFTVVIPQYNCSYYVIRKLEELNAYIAERAGFELKIVKDNEEETEHEIIVGECARSGSAFTGGTEDYAIRCDGGKIYLCGGRNYSVAYAVDEFMASLKKDDTLEVKNASGTYVNGKNAGDYKLVWYDEFNTLDKTKWSIWNIDHGTKKRPSGYGSWFGMTTARSSRPENVHVEDGKLYITATYDDKTYYGARMETTKSMNFVKGYMEMSARIADGDGVWIDFWTWSDEKDHLEMDIMECPGPGDYYDCTVHEFIKSGGQSINDKMASASITRDEIYHDKGSFESSHVYDRSKSLNNEYHTYGAMWEDTYFAFYRDGEEISRREFAGTGREYLYEQPHYFILSMLVGANYNNFTTVEQSNNSKWYKYPDKNLDFWNDDRASFIIEYVQLFQRDGQTIIYK